MTSGKPLKSQVNNSSNKNNYHIFGKMDKNEQYRQAVRILQEKCKSIQRENEKIIYRLHVVKRLTKRREKDVTILKKRLHDSYNDKLMTGELAIN